MSISKQTECKSGTGIIIVALLMIFTFVIGTGVGIWYQNTHVSGAEGVGETEDHASHKTMKTLYTCGMHPEVITDEPGTCPKCNMKLTPMSQDRARMILEARGESVPDDMGDAKKKRKVIYWRAPMDPTYIRNEPGKSPMGMDLVPVYEDDVAGGPTIRIDPVTEQNMGLRYDIVRSGPITKMVRTVGSVEYDENSLGTVTTKISGWIEKIHISETGTQVHKDDPLFDIYSPELYSAQEGYLIALKDQKRAEQEERFTALGLARDRVRSARDRLLFFDIDEAQIQRLEQENKISKTLTIPAQLTGIVTHKNITEGEYLKAGAPAYKIADLSTVWVIGKVYESDLPFIKLGQEAHMQLDYLPGCTYKGHVTYVYPYLEKGTREVPVRVEFHNPGYNLKPGMYVTLRIQSLISKAATLVPAMAVIDTGEKKIVFVMREAGKFEPRRIETGVRNGQDEMQVLSGLAPGEKVVVSGQFLLDSESRLREATLKMLNPGMQNTSSIGESQAKMKEAHAGMDTKGMDHAQKPMVDAVAKYVCPMPSHAGILYDASGDCPICDMKLVPIQSWQIESEKIHHYTCPMPEHYHVSEMTPGKCPECDMTLIPVRESDLERFGKVVENMPISLYTCPMPAHKHVVATEPENCPECNMKLVPTAAVPHGAESEKIWEKTHSMDGKQMQVESKSEPTLYTCPMESHAHVVVDKPGRCPECNMKLVPTDEVDHGPESVKHWKAGHGSKATGSESDSATAKDGEAS